MSSTLTRRDFAAKVSRLWAAIGLAGSSSLAAAARSAASGAADRLLGRYRVSLLLGARPVLATVDTKGIVKQLRAGALDPSETLLLRLEGVEAAKQPGVVWQVYLSEPWETTLQPTRPPFLGNLALFGRGIRGRPGFKPATFSFAADRAVLAALAAGAERLRLTFLATGPIVDGKPSPPRPAAKVKIPTVSFAVRSR